MIDLPDRKSPRFPPALEPLAAEEIERSLRRLRDEFGEDMIGFSSAARGGDLLFLEACEKLGIEAFVVLPFSRAEFVATSVAGVPNGNWRERYDRMLDRLGPNRVEEMTETPSPEAFDKCNLRLLELAGHIGKAVVLLGLLDGDALQQSGGSLHFAERVRGIGGRLDVIDVKLLRGSLGA
jgi:hypothetical protein